MTDLQPPSSAPNASNKPEIVYTLRDIKYHELPAMARVMSLAFWDDQLFGEMIHPGREEYPNDSDLYWLRDARVNFWNRHFKFLAAVVQDPDASGKEKVIGIAQWERLGDGAKKRDLARYDPRNLMKPIMSMAMTLHELLWPNRAVAPVHSDIIERAYPFFDSVWSGKRAESWYLSFLAVHPDYQGIGVGKDLTLWGVGRAEEEGVVASLITVPGTEDFYRRCGFEETFGCARDGEGNPLVSLKGLDIVWKWPSQKANNEAARFST